MKVDSVRNIFNSIKEQNGVLAKIRMRNGEFVAIDIDRDDWEIVGDESSEAYISRQSEDGTCFLFVDEISTIRI